MFVTIPLRIGTPGTSNTLTFVPLGPGKDLITFLMMFARDDPRVDGTAIVAVVLSSLNQLVLSFLGRSLLSSLDL